MTQTLEQYRPTYLDGNVKSRVQRGRTFGLLATTSKAAERASCELSVGIPDRMNTVTYEDADDDTCLWLLMWGYFGTLDFIDC